MTINLPVGTINTIVNIDDKRVEVPIDEAVEFMKESSDNIIRSFDSSFFTIKKEKNGETWNIIEFDKNVSYINKLVVLPITSNNANIEYYKTVIRYWNDIEKEVIIPSYVKFFSYTLKNFQFIKYLKKNDMLVDYQGHNAQIRSCEVIKFEPTEYYNIFLNSVNNYQTNFYFDGLLAYINYTTFQKETNEK